MKWTYLVILLVIAAPAPASAEGSAELTNAAGITQTLVSDTALLVDVVDPRRERIAWRGVGNASVFDPSGNLIATLDDGTQVSVSAAGTYVVSLDEHQGREWSVDLMRDGRPIAGRLASTRWHFNTPSYSREFALTGRFFALVRASESSRPRVIEMVFEGLSGHDFYLTASPQGLVDVPGESADMSGSGGPDAARYPLYLNPPSGVDFSADATNPRVSNARIVSAANSCSTADPLQQLEFDATHAGTYELQCWRDSDDLANQPPTLLQTGRVQAGLNRAPMSSQLDAPHRCQLRLLVGELHFVAEDIETVYPGIRLFEVMADGSRHDLPLLWDDRTVDGSRALPDGRESRVRAGPGDVSSGDYEAPTEPATSDGDGNARAWGRFAATGLGNEAYLDTYTFLERSPALEFDVAPGCEQPGADAGTSDASDAASSVAEPWPDASSALPPYAPDAGHARAPTPRRMYASGGCQTSSNAAGPGAIPLALLIGLLLVASRRRLIAVTLTGALLLASASAFAQQAMPGFRLAPNTLRPADSGGLVVSHPDVMAPGNVAVGAATIWTKDPLFVAWSGEQQSRLDVVSHRVRSRIGARATLLPGAEIGLSWDVAHLQSGALSMFSYRTPRMGDIRVRGKWHLPFSLAEPGFRAAAFGEVGVPTGSRSAFLSDGRLTGEAGVALATRVGMVEPRIDASWQLRRSQRFLDRRIDDMFRWGIAAPIRPVQRLELSVYMRGNHVVSADPGRAIHPLQAGAHLRFLGDRITAFATAGTGVLRDVGAPRFEFASGITLEFDANEQPRRTIESSPPPRADAAEYDVATSPTPQPPGVSEISETTVRLSPELPAAEPPRRARAAPPATGWDLTREVIETSVVYFDTNSAALSMAGIATLVRLARILDEDPSILRVRVEGHADERGTAGSNVRLSLDRARAVRDFLVTQGIAGSRLEVIGYGDSQPARRTRLGRVFAFDRRVGFRVETRDDPE
jgi:uncharacterized protein (TIGR03382 family)